MRQTIDPRFIALLQELPPSIQKKAAYALVIFNHNPRPRSLDFKKIRDKLGAYYRIRITSDYQAVGELSNGEILWFWISSQADYDQLLRRL